MRITSMFGSCVQLTNMSVRLFATLFIMIKERVQFHMSESRLINSHFVEKRKLLSGLWAKLVKRYLERRCKIRSRKTRALKLSTTSEATSEPQQLQDGALAP